MKKSIVLLPGDGIGPEVTAAAASVLKECAREFHHEFQFAEYPVGGTAIDVTGTPLPNATMDACRKADAVFLGAVGGPKWDSLHVSSEAGAPRRSRFGNCPRTRRWYVFWRTGKQHRRRHRAFLGHRVLLHSRNRTHCDFCFCPGGESFSP